MCSATAVHHNTFIRTGAVSTVAMASMFLENQRCSASAHVRQGMCYLHKDEDE